MEVETIPEQVETYWGVFPVGDTTLRVCAWCGDVIAEIERCCGAVSHGMCRECYRQTMADVGEARIAT